VAGSRAYPAQVLPPDVLSALRTGRGPARVPVRGLELLANPLLDKDGAFSTSERTAFGLQGLLPAGVLTIDEQVALELEHIQRKTDPLERYIGLAALQDRNETLFHRVLCGHLEEFLPDVYTPTVGRACEEFSHILRRPRGVWITPDDVGRAPEILRNTDRDDVRLVVVTDNERILGLGDQGAGGMAIPVGKLAIYTAAAGIHPSLTLPVSLDVGTDRAELLADPLYAGWRRPRLRGPAYDAVVESFVAAVAEVFPRAIIQWEDFKQHNAIRLLDRYRDRVPSFNDDIQGTGAAVLAGIIAALRTTGQRLEDQRIVILGAGGAGIGIARLIRSALLRAGTPALSVRRSIAMLDSHGLVAMDRAGLEPDKRDFAFEAEDLEAYGLPSSGSADLLTVVRAVRPTVLIGTSGVAGSFTEAAIRAMADALGPEGAPIILPLSNPTTKSEAIPADVLAWTDGRAIVAAGSPFAPVDVGGSARTVSQANNVYVFPGIGLGVIVAEARTIPDEIFLLVADHLGSLVSRDAREHGALYPPVAALREIARSVAIEVVRFAASSGIGRPFTPEEAVAAVDAEIWWPEYIDYLPA
jgi:malic enzyme